MYYIILSLDMCMIQGDMWNPKSILLLHRGLWDPKTEQLGNLLLLSLPNQVCLRHSQQRKIMWGLLLLLSCSGFILGCWKSFGATQEHPVFLQRSARLQDCLGTLPHKSLPCSWISRITIVKMTILPKTIFNSMEFNGISIKNPTQ